MEFGMLDLLPEASLGFKSILLQICFVNQAFLGLEFFLVQGSNRALLVNNGLDTTLQVVSILIG
jgi:hypothetical protein